MINKTKENELISYGSRRNKTCLRGFLQSETQASLLSYRDYLENCKYTCSKFRYHTIQKANKKCVDQTAQICAFAVGKHRAQVLSRRDKPRNLLDYDCTKQNTLHTLLVLSVQNEFRLKYVKYVTKLGYQENITNLFILPEAVGWSFHKYAVRHFSSTLVIKCKISLKIITTFLT